MNAIARSSDENDWSDVSRTDTRHRPAGRADQPPLVQAQKSPTRPATGAKSRPRIAATRPIAGLHASRAPRVPFAVLVISMLVGGIALLLVLNTASAANELDRQRFADADANAAAQVQQLHNEVASSAAPANLARAAQGLGMVPAGNPAFLVVAPDGSVTVRGSASPVAPQAVAVAPPTKPKSKTHKSKTKTKTDKSKTKTDKTKSKSKTAKTDKSKTKTDKTTAKTNKSKTAKNTPTNKHSHGGHR